MTDVAREGLMRLMAEVEELEEGVEELQRKLRSASPPSGSQDGDAARRELGALLERLEQKRDELTRISNACRRPHRNV